MTRKKANGSPKRAKSQRVSGSTSCGGGRGCCRSPRQNKERLFLPRPGRTRVSEIGGFYEAEHRSDIFWLDYHRGYDLRARRDYSIKWPGGKTEEKTVHSGVCDVTYSFTGASQAFP